MFGAVFATEIVVIVPQFGYDRVDTRAAELERAGQVDFGPG